ncbi:MAG: helix-hairpin-helix domain-containing protein [Ignavibacteriae bacterium]|nr:helix-hairpin-helix domain-containing protein [Ignavibacteriota bacterium]
MSGLVVGVIVRYNPFAATHPSQYNPVLAEKIYSVLDSIADADEQDTIAVPVTGSETVNIADTAKAIDRFTDKKKELYNQKVNIATALKAELIRLPGIGEAIAERIIVYRKIQPFTSTQDLMNVKGIGSKKFEKIKPYIFYEKKNK